MNQLRPIVQGCVDAPILTLDAPVSFWGGVDMETGRVIDRSHPQCGTLIGGYCLVVPTIRGSGGTPGNLAMTLKLGVGPASIVIGYPDVNVMAGIVVAKHLYASECPMFVASVEQRQRLLTGRFIRVDEDGSYTLV